VLPLDQLGEERLYVVDERARRCSKYQALPKPEPAQEPVGSFAFGGGS